MCAIGQPSHGTLFTLILQVLSMVMFYLLWWTRLQSGRKSARCTTNTFAAIIKELRTIFTTFSLPRTILPDNGAVSVSGEVKTFYRNNGLVAVTSAPY